MQNEVKKRIISYETRIAELERNGITEASLNSCCCVDCTNSKLLSSCPNDCDGIGDKINDPAGYNRDTSIEVVI
jgi:hypothetical protein